MLLIVTLTVKHIGNDTMIRCNAFDLFTPREAQSSVSQAGGQDVPVRSLSVIRCKVLLLFYRGLQRSQRPSQSLGGKGGVLGMTC